VEVQDFILDVCGLNRSNDFHSSFRGLGTNYSNEIGIKVGDSFLPVVPIFILVWRAIDIRNKERGIRTYAGFPFIVRKSPVGHK
jgi:hypothetical protein